MPGNFLNNRNQKRAIFFNHLWYSNIQKESDLFDLKKQVEKIKIFPKVTYNNKYNTKIGCVLACSWFGLHRVLVSGYPVGIAWHHIPKDRKMQTSFHNGTESGNLLPLRQSVVVYGNRARWKTIVCAAMWLTFNSCKATVSNVAGAFEISR